MDQIKLDYPITVAGAETKELNMRRPKVRDLRDAQKAGKSATDAEVEIRLFANLCEVAPSVIEELDMADYSKVQERYQGFLSRE